MEDSKEYTITLTYSELLAARVAMDHWMHECETLYIENGDSRHNRACDSIADKMDNAWVGRS